MSELSTRLRLRRKELGLSQEELAQRMGETFGAEMKAFGLPFQILHHKAGKGRQRPAAGQARGACCRAGDHSRLPAGAGCALSAAGF